MRLWMHGTGQDIPQSVQKLKSIGFEAVVGNDPQLIQSAGSAGMDVYLCSGAFGVNGIFAGEQYLAQDINGERRHWFNSTCPNQPAVRSANLESIARMAQTEGIRGILIDGARFASLASDPNPDAFYTCFCPVCMSKAESMGFNPHAMQTAVRMLYRQLHGDTSVSFLPHLQGILDWFAFRRQSTTEHLLQFCDTVKNTNSDLLTGIYIFTPALAPLVGQNYPDLGSRMDIFAPMIYRAYSGKEGPACLNHEVSMLVNELSQCILPTNTAIQFLSILLQLPLEAYGNAEEILEGLPPAVIGTETRRAKSRTTGHSQLIPIIQLDDPELDKCIRSMESSGVDGLNFFVYQDEWLEHHRELLEGFSASGTTISSVI